MGDVLEWVDKGKGVFVAETKITTVGNHWMDRPRTRTVRFRIDTRHGTIRADRLDYVIWESIDGGVPFESLPEARTFVARWVDEARRQKTIAPKVQRTS